jgi:hypothetical protein
MIAGCGGVLRGERREWLCGFSKCLGVRSAYVANLWGVFVGRLIISSKSWIPKSRVAC